MHYIITQHSISIAFIVKAFCPNSYSFLVVVQMRPLMLLQNWIMERGRTFPSKSMILSVKQMVGKESMDFHLFFSNLHWFVQFSYPASKSSLSQVTNAYGWKVRTWQKSGHLGTTYTYKRILKKGALINHWNLRNIQLLYFVEKGTHTWRILCPALGLPA